MVKVYLRDLPFSRAAVCFWEKRTDSGQAISFWADIGQRNTYSTKPKGIEGFQAESTWLQGAQRSRDGLTDGRTQ